MAFEKRIPDEPHGETLCWVGLQDHADFAIRSRNLGLSNHENCINGPAELNRMEMGEEKKEAITQK